MNVYDRILIQVELEVNEQIPFEVFMNVNVSLTGGEEGGGKKKVPILLISSN